MYRPPDAVGPRIKSGVSPPLCCPGLHRYHVLCFSSLSSGKLILPTLYDLQWKRHDSNIKTLPDPIHHQLKHDVVSPSESAKQLSDVLRNCLSDRSDFFTGDERNQQQRRKQDVDTSAEMIRRAKEEKKRLRRWVVGRRKVDPSLRHRFYEAIKTQFSCATA